jgi:Rab3 GTPase-activating protein catalytic subunit
MEKIVEHEQSSKWSYEPIVREIIFSVRDSLRNNHHAAHNPRGFHQELETYRMYICGT